MEEKKTEGLNNPYLQMNHIKVDEVRRDYVRLYVDLVPELCNPYGIAHGGLLFTLSDCCAGINARTDGRSYVTLDSDFHFMNNVSAGRITAESYVLRRGGRVCVLRANTHDEDGNVLTDGTFTMYCVDKNEQPGK